MTVRVLLVDDQDMTRVGLEMMLTGDADIEVVGQARSAGRGPGGRPRLRGRARRPRSRGIGAFCWLVQPRILWKGQV